MTRTQRSDPPSPNSVGRVRDTVRVVVHIVRSVVSRLGWGLADQGLSSVTNFALGVLVARSLAPPEFGAFAIAFSVYTIALGVARALTGEPMVVRFSAAASEDSKIAAGAVTGTSIVVGIVAGLVCIASGIVVRGALGWGLTALGLTMPGLLLQDAWRFVFFSTRRGVAAFLNDLAWAIILVFCIVFLLLAGKTSIWWLVLAWGGSGSVAGLLGIFQARVVPAAGKATGWFRQQRDLIPRFIGEFGITTLVAQVTIFAIGALAGLADVGTIRAGQLLLGPLNVIFLGIGMAGLPEAVRALLVSEARLRQACVFISAALALCALGVGAFGSVLPDRFGTALLGENWPFAQRVVVPLSIGMAGSGVIMGAGVGLRALAAARLSLRARLVVAPLVLATALSGAALWGARGAAWGFAVAYTIGSVVWWRYFLQGMRDHKRGDVVSAVGLEEPSKLGIPEGFDA